MESRKFKTIKFIFAFFGFESCWKWRKVSVFQLNVIFFMLHIMLLIMFRSSIVFTRDLIGEVCDTITVLFAIISWISGLFVSLKTSKYQRKLKKKFAEFEELIKKFYVDPAPSMLCLFINYKRKFYTLVGLQVLRSSFEVINAIQEDSTMSINFTLYVLYSLYFSKLKHLHTIFYLDMLNRYYQILIEQIKHLNELFDCNQNLKNVKYEKFLMKMFTNAHEYLQKLSETKSLINEWNEPFIVIHQLNLFVNISGSLYWTVYRIFNQSENLSNYIIFNCPNFVALTIFFLLALTDSCEQIQENSKYVAYEIHNIRITNRIKSELFSDVVENIENISIDLSNNNFEYWASGFFAINYRWFSGVRRIISSIKYF